MSYTMELAEAANPTDEIIEDKGVKVADRPQGGAVPARLADGFQGRSPVGDLRLLQSERDLGLRLRRERRDYACEPRGASRAGLICLNAHGRRGPEGAVRAVRVRHRQANVRRLGDLCRRPVLRHRSGWRSVPEDRRLSQPDFSAAGSTPFIYVAKGKSRPTSYWSLPTAAHEDGDELRRSRLSAACGCARRSARRGQPRAEAEEARTA